MKNWHTFSERLKTHESKVINEFCETSHTFRQIIYTKDEERYVEHNVVCQDRSKDILKRVVNIKYKVIQLIAKIINVIKPIICKILYDIFYGVFKKLIINWVIKQFE